MQTRKIYTIVIVFLVFNFAFGQNGNSNGSFEFWKMQSYSGFIELESQYRAQQTILRTSAEENRTSSLFTGLFSLRTKSFFWHPNFMKLNVDFDYNPSTGKDQFLVLPDRTETKTAEMVRVQTSFFEQRPFSFNLYANLNHNFINREYTTNVEMYRRGFGGSIIFKNNFTPISFRYQNEKWEQDEIQSDRKFTNDRENYTIEISKSFSHFDKNQFSYSIEDYYRTYSKLSQIHNKILNLNLKNDINLDKNKDANINSFIWYNKQTGDDKYNRLQVNESIDSKLPYNFKVIGKYQFSNYKKKNFNLDQHNISSRLEHRLFSSLFSHAQYEYMDIHQSSYNEFLNTYNIGFDYNKIIPTGNFSLSFSHRERNENRNGKAFDLQVNNEDHILSDTQTLLLQNPDVIVGSIVITDETGLIIYEANFDYILIERGDFIEIQRLPGGLIQDGSSILIDYMATQQLNYEFDVASNNFHTGISLFSNFVNLYFRYFEQDNDNFSGTDNRILKNISQRVYGSRFNYKRLSLGIELDDFNSNIVPYNSKRYYLTFVGNINQSINYSLSGNYRDYKLIEEDISQKYSDMSGHISYRINNKSQIKAKGAYRFQEGRNIDLTLTTFKGEYLTNYRKILITLGVDFYQRDYLNEDITFNGGYIKIKRNF